MPTLNEDLLDRAVDSSVDFTRYNNGVVRRIIALLNRTDKDLFEQLTAALDRLPAESFTVERLDMLLQSVRRLNESAYTALQRELQVELKDLVAFESSYQLSLFKNVLPVQVVVAAVNVEQVYSAALSRPMQGRLMKEWAKSLEADKMTRIRDALRMGYVENQTVGQMITRLRGTRAKGYSDGLIEIDRRNCAAVVRTATAHTANFTRQRFYEANESIIKGLKWVSTLDSRTSPVCRARDGEMYPVNSGPRPPAHWNCLPGTAKVTVHGSITRAYKRPYKGQLLIIKTASGREISCTPNHPILSDRGWIPAQSLNLGDNVVCDISSERIPVGNDDKNNHVPSSIHDVAEAFFVASGVLTIEVPISAPDFHGDGIGSQVAIVGTDSRLLVGDDATVGKHSDEHVFGSGTSFGHSFVVGVGGEQFGCHGDGSPCCCDVRSAGNSGSFLRGISGHAGELLGAPISQSDARLFECESDSCGWQVELIGNASYTNSAIKHGFSRSDVEPRNRSLESPVLHSASSISNTVLVEYTNNNLISDTVPIGDFCYGKPGIVQPANICDREVDSSPVPIQSLSIKDAADIGCRHADLGSDSRCCFSGHVHRQDGRHEPFSCDSHLFKSATDGDSLGAKGNTDGVIRNSEHPTDFLDSVPIGIEVGNSFGVEYFPPLSGYSGAVEPAVNDADIDSKIASNILDGNACAIFLDHIVSVDVQEFSGHVYNLETDCGWFVADGIITHNCRSCMSPVTKSWREMGIDLDDLPESTRASISGQVPESMTYQDWLRKQSAARQDDILGKSKGLLFRNGELPLTRFVDRAGKELTLKDLREKHADAFRKAGL